MRRSFTQNIFHTLILPQDKLLDKSDIQVIFKQMISNSLLDGMSYFLKIFPSIKNDFHNYFTDLLGSFYSDENSYTYYFKTTSPFYSKLGHSIVVYENKSLNFLLKYGIKLSVDSNGRSLLHHAAITIHNEYDEIFHIKALLDYGFHIDAIDHQGRTPLHLAVEAGLFYHAMSLIYWGADTTIIDKNKKSIQDKIAHFHEQDTDPDDDHNQNARADLLKII